MIVKLCIYNHWQPSLEALIFTCKVESEGNRVDAAGDVTKCNFLGSNSQELSYEPSMHCH